MEDKFKKFHEICYCAVVNKMCQIFEKYFQMTIFPISSLTGGVLTELSVMHLGRSHKTLEAATGGFL